jgi:hypothetical protein
LGFRRQDFLGRASSLRSSGNGTKRKTIGSASKKTANGFLRVHLLDPVCLILSNQAGWSCEKTIGSCLKLFKAFKAVCRWSLHATLRLLFNGAASTSF